MNARLQGRCVCGNGNDGRFWILRPPDDDDGVWGICCKKKKCQTEFLIPDFCQEEADGGDHEEPVRVRWDGVELIKKNPPRRCNNRGFQASLKRVRVKRVQQLKRGDQITWSRKYFIWHHGVVTQVNANSFEVVNWTKVNKQLKIVKEIFEENALKRAFQIDHGEVYTSDRARDLTVSRAYSRLHAVENVNNDETDNGDDNDNGDGDDDDNDDKAYTYSYNFTKRNCEHFATYCVRGTGDCFQNTWAVVRALETVEARAGGTVGKALAIMMSEAIENSTRSSELVGAVGVIIIELISLFYDFHQLRTMFKRGEISRTVFYHELIKHLTGTACGMLGGVIGGVASCSIPALEILLAPLLGLLGKFGGMQLGSEIGLAITDKYIERDEKAVSNINSLQPGDHIVKTKFGGIFRTHGIFVALGEREGFIVAILFKKKRIVKLEIKFSGIRRMMYSDDELLADPGDVISAAELFIANPAPRVRSRKEQVISCKIIPQV